MSAEDDFLRDVRDHPDDDGPRLVFADWLDERGDSRGSFIRLQCEYAGLPDDDPRRGPLQGQAEELLRAHAVEWGKAAPSGVGVWFERGFLQVTAGHRTLTAAPAAAGWWQHHWRWTGGLRLYDLDDEQCRELAVGRLGPQVFQLDVSHTEIGDPGLWWLSRLPELRGMHLAHTRITDVGLAYLARLRQLRQLSLRGTGTGIGDVGLAHLASLDHLRALDVSLTGVTPEGQAALCRALPRLRLLS